MRTYSFDYNISSFIDNSYSFIGIYSDIFLIVCILFIICYLVILSYLSLDYLILTNISFTLSLYTILFTGYILYQLKDIVLNNFFSSLLIIDFIQILKIITIFFFVLIIFLSKDYLKKDFIVNYEYFLISLLSILGLFVILSSYDLISMYLGIELQSLCFYILATFKQYSNFSTEAGIKYFILGAFSSGILLFGCSLLYGFTGIIDFYNLELLFKSFLYTKNFNNGLIAAFLFISVGLLFKLGSAPFHNWSPDVYEGSPTIITSFFAVIPKMTILFLLLRFLVIFPLEYIYYQNFLLTFCAILSLLIGTFGAIWQISLKRLLAYSSISHVGFLLTGLTIGTVGSWISVFFYILIYMILSITLFSLILSIRKYTNYLKLKKINEVKILFNSNNTLVFIFILSLFSVAGIPPLIGFYSKFYIFISGLNGHFYFLTLVAAVVSVISSLYYIRLIKLMVFKPTIDKDFFCNISQVNSLIISSTFLVNFFFLFCPNIIMLWLHNLVLTLLL